MFTEKSTFADLALFLAKHDLRCRRLSAPGGNLTAACTLEAPLGGANGAHLRAYGTGATIAEAINDAIDVLRRGKVIS